MAAEAQTNNVRLKSVMVVENESLIAAGLRKRLEKFGYSVPAMAKTADDAMRLAASNAPDLILMDIQLKGPKDGIEAAREIRNKLDIPIIFVTAQADNDTIERAKLASSFGYIVRPFGETDLRGHLEMAHAKHELERRLRRSEAWLATTLHSVGDAVIVTGREGVVNFMNRAAEAMTGWDLSGAKGRLVAEIFDIQDQQTLDIVANPAMKVLNPDGPGRLSETYRLYPRNGGGSFRLIEAVASVNRDQDEVMGAVLAFRDIGARQQQEEQARRSERVDAATALAGAFAADFENLVNTVLENSRAALAGSGAARTELEIIRRAAEKASVMTRQLAELSRTPADCSEVLDLNLAVLACAGTVRQILGGQRELLLNLSNEPCRVRADSGRIEQILVNLARNAVAAMARRSRFSIQTGAVGPSEVELLVSYTGSGTGSATGRSATGGIGLAVAENIVGLNGGELSLERGPGLGSTFRIRFPMAGIPAPPRSAATPSDSSAIPRILLVEQDREVRRLLHNEFENAGCQLIEAASCEEAMEILDIGENRIDVLVAEAPSDRPEATGLVGSIISANPKARILYVSQDEEEGQPPIPVTIPAAAVSVKKSVSPAELVSAVSALLSTPRD